MERNKTKENLGPREKLPKKKWYLYLRELISMERAPKAGPHAGPQAIYCVSTTQW